MKEKQLTKREKASLVAAVEKAIIEMEQTGEKMDFQAIARKLGLARSTLYRNPTVRSLIINAREKQNISSLNLFQMQQQLAELKERVDRLEYHLFQQDT